MAARTSARCRGVFSFTGRMLCISSGSSGCARGTKTMRAIVLPSYMEASARMAGGVMTKQQSTRVGEAAYPARTITSSVRMKAGARIRAFLGGRAALTTKNVSARGMYLWVCSINLISNGGGAGKLERHHPDDEM